MEPISYNLIRLTDSDVDQTCDLYILVALHNIHYCMSFNYIYDNIHNASICQVLEDTIYSACLC